jgi:hypothetical protein
MIQSREKEFYGSVFIALVLCVVLFLFGLGGCTPVVTTKYITTQLTHEPRPVLPKVSSSEISCLSKETYQKLYDRQRLIGSYAVTLETIIDSTKKDIPHAVQ